MQNYVDKNANTHTHPPTPTSICTHMYARMFGSSCIQVCANDKPEIKSLESTCWPSELEFWPG